MISFPSLKRIRRHYLSKMLVAFSLTTLAIIVITNVFIFHREQHTLTAHLIDQGNQTATFLAHTVRLGVLAENKEQMEVPVAAALDIDQVINVAIFTLNGQQIIM
ncbi:MAG: hypothetical protein OEV91_06100, partial [Desulfobulbaceae bacterium]|nr:hypothetical protein [Desulfobulbaceae bacterium]